MTSAARHDVVTPMMVSFMLPETRSHSVTRMELIDLTVRGDDD